MITISRIRLLVYISAGWDILIQSLMCSSAFDLITAKV